MAAGLPRPDSQFSGYQLGHFRFPIHVQGSFPSSLRTDVENLLPRLQQHITSPVSEIAAGGNTISPSSFSVDMDPIQNTHSEQSGTLNNNNISQGQTGNTAVNGSSHTHVHHEHNHNPVQSDWRFILRWLQKSGIFAVILFIKVMYDHRLGLLVFLSLFGTYCYANRTLERHTHQLVVRQSSQRRTFLILLWLITFLSVNILCIYVVFADQQLYKVLIFQLPNINKMDIWTLSWVVGVTDFVLKFLVIVLKSVVSMWPRTFMPYRQRGKYFLCIEQVLQFYRCLTPIVPWVFFLLDDSYGGHLFSTLLIVIYVAFKINILWLNSCQLLSVIRLIRSDMNLGTKPTCEEVKTAGDSCPICQDDFSNPVMLSCKHIFCEDCVSLWFDREQTCPMCRARITDNPSWREGAASPNVQWY